MSARILAAIACLAALTAGCSPAHYTADADREVYGIVADKNAETLGRVHDFTVRPNTDLPGMLETAQSKPRMPAPPVPERPTPAADAEAQDGTAFETVVPENLPPPVPEPGPDAVRLTMALIYMGGIGISSACIGGGQGGALIIKSYLNGK